VTVESELEEVREELEEQGETVFAVSAVARSGLGSLLRFLAQAVQQEREARQNAPEPEPVEAASVWED